MLLDAKFKLVGSWVLEFVSNRSPVTRFAATLGEAVFRFKFPFHG